MKRFFLRLSFLLLLSYFVIACGNGEEIATPETVTRSEDTSTIIITTTTEDFGEPPLVAEASPSNTPEAAPQQHPLGVMVPAIVSAEGEPPNDSIYNAEISDDGRWIAFQSRADNLVAEDTNGSDDIFLLDRENNTIELVSVAPDGTQATSDVALSGMSGHGRYILFWSFMGNVFPQSFEGPGQIYLRDTVAKETQVVSVSGTGELGNGGSAYASLSSDGRYIVFTSNSSNLTADAPNEVCESAFTGAEGLDCEDIFLHDRETGETELISILADGTAGDDRADYAQVSDDGRWVAYSTSASNFLESDPNDGACYDPPTSSQVNCTDIFLLDRETGEATLVSKADDGTPGNKGASSFSISADGRYVVYTSDSDNLVQNDTNAVGDVFLYDHQSQSTTRISAAADGTEGDGTSLGGDITPDGRYIVFSSQSNNLVEGDTNTGCYPLLFGTSDTHCEDSFLLDRETNSLTRLTYMPNGEQANVHISVADYTSDLRYFLLTGPLNAEYHYELYLLERENELSIQ